MDDILLLNINEALTRKRLADDVLPGVLNGLSSDSGEPPHEA